MYGKCTRCGSYAINPHCHGRDLSVRLDLCDVCYWRSRSEDLREALESTRGFIESDDLRFALKRIDKALAGQPTPEPTTNRDREDEWPTWPRVGKRYLVWFSGVLQHETYEFDRGDDGNGGGEFFWGRDDVDECPPFDPDNHRWLALDDIDAARAGEDE